MSVGAKRKCCAQFEPFRLWTLSRHGPASRVWRSRFRHYQSTRLSRYDAVFCAGGTAMRRREFLGLVGGAATWPLAARAQERAVLVIGFLSPTTSAAAARLYRPLWAGLRELGHIDGRNIT